MRPEQINRLIQSVMAGALVLTALPIAVAWLPSGSLAVAPQGAGDAAGAPNRIAVELRHHLSPEAEAALGSKLGITFQENSHAEPDERVLVADVPADREAAILQALRRESEVEAAEPIHRYVKSWVPNDPRYPEQWNLKMVGAEKAWDRATGKGVTVAVIDTGVAFESDDKCYRAKDFDSTRFVPGYDFVNKDEHPNDDNGHGTHVAGTIAESTNNGEGVAGLAFDAAIMPLKVLDQWGSGSSADIADAIQFAADHGAQVINMSLGGAYPDTVMEAACKYAAKKGVLIVCAAGNSGGGPVGYPAGFPECMAVSAVGPTGELAPYSSIGKQVAIAAPGGDTSRGEQFGILQNTLLDGDRQSDGYYGFQGTSMASPHVAAVAALIMSAGVKDATEVKQILARGATPKGPANRYGAGILSASKSVDLAFGARRDSLLKIAFALLAAATGIGLGAYRRGAGALLRFPFLPLGFVLGFLGPDLIFGWIGFGTPFNLLFHSALVPLYLLWEVESSKLYRFVAVLSVGTAAHLAWDAVRGEVPLGGVLPGHAVPWLWVNVIIGIGVTLVALRRSFANG